MAAIEDPERLESEVRVAMFHHSRIDPDGYDPKNPRRQRLRERAEIHAEIDGLLDRWAMARLLLALERIASEPEPA